MRQEDLSNSILKNMLRYKHIPFYSEEEQENQLVMPQECLDNALIQKWSVGEVINYSAEKKGIYFVLDGLVKQIYILETGIRRQLYLIEENSFLYEIHNFSSNERQSFAEVEKNCTTAFFNNKQAYNYIENNSDFSRLLIRSLLNKLIQSSTNQVDVAVSNVSSRIGHVLRRLAIKQGLQTKAGIELRLSQDTLSELLGLHRVTINRALNRLARLGVIHLLRNKIIILDIEKL